MSVTVTQNLIAQLERSFEAVLSNPSFGVIGGASSAAVAITDDDSKYGPHY